MIRSFCPKKRDWVKRCRLDLVFDEIFEDILGEKSRRGDGELVEEGEERARVQSYRRRPHVFGGGRRWWRLRRWVSDGRGRSRRREGLGRRLLGGLFSGWVGADADADADAVLQQPLAFQIGKQILKGSHFCDFFFRSLDTASGSWSTWKCTLCLWGFFRYRDFSSSVFGMIKNRFFPLSLIMHHYRDSGVNKEHDIITYCIFDLILKYCKANRLRKGIIEYCFCLTTYYVALMASWCLLTFNLRSSYSELSVDSKKFFHTNIRVNSSIQLRLICTSFFLIFFVSKIPNFFSLLSVMK